MKIRNGFVSNSSTSSFICEICGENNVGRDLCLSECDMFECEFGHVMCNEHAIGDLITSEGEEDSYDVVHTSCPICNFDEPSYSDLANYLLKIIKITRNEVFAEIKKVNKRRKVLRDNEYVKYVLNKENKSVDSLLEELKEKYKTYPQFKKEMK